MLDTIYLLALLVIATIVSLVFFMIRSDRRQRQLKSDLVARLGFNPSDIQDTDLGDRTVKLHTPTDSQQLELTNTYLRTAGEVRFLLFGLVDTSDGISMLQEDGIAVFSNHLNLLRFSIFPEVVDGGHLSMWGNRFLEKLLVTRKYCSNDVAAWSKWRTTRGSMNGISSSPTALPQSLSSLTHTASAF